VVADVTAEGARLAQEQLDVSRAFAAGSLSTSHFVELFLRTWNAEVDAGSCNETPFLDVLDDIWFAIDMHNEYDDLRSPEEFDDAQLREVVTGYLADWDAGTWQYDPRWER
jgi:hypothetical protein